jgi:hypothetical protein
VQHHCIIQALFFRAQRLDARYYTGERSHSLWKDRCASAHAPATENSDKSSARIPQTAQYRVEMVYAYTRVILTLDRRIFDIPLKERLQSRTYDLVAWTTTMYAVIHQSIRRAQAQLRTGHHSTRSYFSDTTAAEPTTNATPKTPTVLTIT